MKKNALSIFNQLRPVSVGFDNVFDHFEKMFEEIHQGTTAVAVSNGTAALHLALVSLGISKSPFWPKKQIFFCENLSKYFSRPNFFRFCFRFRSFGANNKFFL